MSKVGKSEHYPIMRFKKKRGPICKSCKLVYAPQKQCAEKIAGGMCPIEKALDRIGMELI